MALKMHPSLAVHVGDWLKTEIVEPAQVSVTALAEHFGVSRQALSTLLNGNSNLSADMAIRFEKAFGIKADTLLRMQTTYELAQARKHEQDIKVEKLGTVRNFVLGRYLLGQWEAVFEHDGELASDGVPFAH
jgi:addiction module HigA family antidote